MSELISVVVTVVAYTFVLVGFHTSKELLKHDYATPSAGYWIEFPYL